MHRHSWVRIARRGRAMKEEGLIYFLADYCYLLTELLLSRRLLAYLYSEYHLRYCLLFTIVAIEFVHAVTYNVCHSVTP